jgi:ADP-heptose:LPS heptosyltransferase
MAGEPNKILVIKLSALGDFVLALAAMRKIREAHPDAHITLLTTPPFEGLAKASPYVDAVDVGGRPQGPGEWLSLVLRLRAARYHRVYDLQTSSRSSLMFFGLLPFPPQWSGIAWGCSHPHRNPRRNQMHTLERQADQLKYAGVWPDAPTEPMSAPPPDLSWIVDKVQLPRTGGGQARPTVLLIPGGAAHRPEKRWPAERYGELARALFDRGYDIVIIGGPQEGELAHKIQRILPQARDLTGRTDFARIAALGARAAVVIGNDTGPLHLAAAAGAPTIVLFSQASDPALSAPRGHVAVLQAADLADLPTSAVLSAVDNMTPQPALNRA